MKRKKKAESTDGKRRITPHEVLACTELESESCTPSRRNDLLKFLVSMDDDCGTPEGLPRGIESMMKSYRTEVIEAEVDNEIEEILKMAITPSKFAATYLKHPGKLAKKMPMSHATGAAYLAAIMLAGIKKGYPHKVDTVSNIIQEGLAEFVAPIKERLPDKLHTLDNSIYRALADFEIFMEESNKAKERFSKFGEITKEHLPLETMKDIKAIDRLVKSTLPIHPDIKKYLIGIKEKLYYYARKPYREVRELNDVQAIMLYKISTPYIHQPPTLLGGELTAKEKATNTWRSTYGYIKCALLRQKKSSGRPPQLFYKALQIVMYKLLLRQMNNISALRARKMVAVIINTYFKGKALKPLTAKDIDNAVQSSK